MLNKKITIKLAIIIFVLIVIVLVGGYSFFYFLRSIQNEEHFQIGLEITTTVLTTILSTVVAYIVAILQLQKERKLKEDEDTKKNVKRLGLIRVEIEDNLDVLERVAANEFPENIKDTIKHQISQEMWEIESYKIEVSEELIKKLYVTNKNLKHMKNMNDQEFKEIYQSFIENYRDVKTLLTTEIEKITN